MNPKLELTWSLPLTNKNWFFYIGLNNYTRNTFKEYNFFSYYVFEIIVVKFYLHFEKFPVVEKFSKKSLSTKRFGLNFSDLEKLPSTSTSNKVLPSEYLGLCPAILINFLRLGTQKLKNVFSL